MARTGRPKVLRDRTIFKFGIEQSDVDELRKVSEYSGVSMGHCARIAVRRWLDSQNAGLFQTPVDSQNSSV